MNDIKIILETTDKTRFEMPNIKINKDKIKFTEELKKIIND